MRSVIILLFPVLLFGNLTFYDNYSEQVEIVKRLDIEPSFLNDKFLLQKLSEYRKIDRKVSFIKTMKESKLFIPSIKKIISDSDVPKEFLYLAMAESEFSARAVSPKSAAGIWQFIPSTAYLYGLRIDEYVDERLDMIKSTKVAIQFLSDLYRKFGKWYLAAIAYNCGEGKLRRAIREAGTDDLRVLLNPDKKFIPLESRIYIRKIVALALLQKGDDSYIGPDLTYLMNRGDAFSLARVRAVGGERLSRIAKIIGMDYSELKKFNSHLKYDLIPPKEESYDIYIPYSKLVNFKTSYTLPRKITNGVVHTVKNGESLYKIGAKYGVGYRRIVSFNSLKSHRLSVGQTLIIPVGQGKVSKRRGRTTRKRVYFVKKGDTLHSIAKSFRTDIQKLMETNNLSSYLIQIGEKLIVTK
jgi:membrane-bound lytic murein transglycosylase D